MNTLLRALSGDWLSRTAWEAKRKTHKDSIFQFVVIAFAAKPVSKLLLTYRLVWLMTSLSFSWSVDGFLSRPIVGRLRKSCCVLSDIKGSLLIGDCDCWRCSKCGYCCLKDVLKFMKPEIDGEPSRVEFCVKWNHKRFFHRSRRSKILTKMKTLQAAAFAKVLSCVSGAQSE